MSLTRPIQTPMNVQSIKKKEDFLALPPPIKILSINDVNIIKPIITRALTETSNFKHKATQGSVWKLNGSDQEF